jgi:hypothetical protein
MDCLLPELRRACGEENMGLCGQNKENNVGR